MGTLGRTTPSLQLPVACTWPSGRAVQLCRPRPGRACVLLRHRIQWTSQMSPAHRCATPDAPRSPTGPVSRRPRQRTRQNSLPSCPGHQLVRTWQRVLLPVQARNGAGLHATCTSASALGTSGCLASARAQPRREALRPTSALQPPPAGEPPPPPLTHRSTGRQQHAGAPRRHGGRQVPQAMPESVRAEICLLGLRCRSCAPLPAPLMDCCCRTRRGHEAQHT
mmetsp:Transcript_6557/g.26693  ORF Transcript_6557/g.26693 Transcript_6557/m.26693 type:complete len:223 (-) Transcript_6557:297-965(-)